MSRESDANDGDREKLPRGSSLVRDKPLNDLDTAAVSGKSSLPSSIASPAETDGQAEEERASYRG